MHELDFARFVDWAFLSGIAATAVWIAKSLTKLNEKMATIIERTAWHERELVSHNHRLRDLEKNKGQ